MGQDRCQALETCRAQEAWDNVSPVNNGYDGLRDWWALLVADSWSPEGVHSGRQVAWRSAGEKHR